MVLRWKGIFNKYCIKCYEILPHSSAWHSDVHKLHCIKHCMIDYWEDGDIV